MSKNRTRRGLHFAKALWHITSLAFPFTTEPRYSLLAPTDSAVVNEAVLGPFKTKPVTPALLNCRILSIRTLLENFMVKADKKLEIGNRNYVVMLLSPNITKPVPPQRIYCAS